MSRFPVELYIVQFKFESDLVGAPSDKQIRPHLHREVRGTVPVRWYSVPGSLTAVDGEDGSMTFLHILI